MASKKIPLPPPIDNDRPLVFSLSSEVSNYHVIINQYHIFEIPQNPIKFIKRLIREASLFMGWGGTSEIGRPAKFWTLPEGGGAKNFRLDQFFFNVPKTHFFSCFWGIWGTFHFFGLGGGEKFQTLR